MNRSFQSASVATAALALGPASRRSSGITQAVGSTPPFCRRMRHWSVAFLVGALGTLLLLPGAAFAQSAQGPPDNSQKPAESGIANSSAPSALDEVVVTGTHIRGVAPVGSPVIAVTRDDIEQTGATTISEILQLQPQIVNSGITDASRNGTGGSHNPTLASSINLRGLSPYATLTLIDGFRVDPAGPVGSAVDPNNVPAIMLQRVDVVPDGASAAYGSDAIAGVVNLVLRRNFEGVELQSRGGWGNNYSEHQADALVGHTWDSGQFTAGFEYSYSSALNGQDRSFYNSNLTSHGYQNLEPNTCSPGTIVYGGNTYAIPKGGVTPATAAALVPGTQNLCDPARFEDILPQQQRYNFAATFNQDITPWLGAFAEAFYSYRNYSLKEPLASGPITVTSANPYYVAVPGNTTGMETVNYWFGNQGIGNTWTDYGHSQNYNFILGVNLKLPADWALQLNGTYGHDEDTDTEIGVSASSPGVMAALRSTDPATALNLFGPNSAALLKSLDNNADIIPNYTSLYNAQAKLDGPLFALPGGQVKLALGYEFEAQKLAQGLAIGTAESYALAFGGYQHLSRSSNSVYGELLVPVVGPENHIPFVERFDIDVSGRYTDYSDIGSTTNPKIGVNWQINDDLKIHGSWGTSFRAPNLSDTFAPLQAVYYQSYATPIGPVTGYTLSVNQPGLRPETATTWSIGGEWTSSFVPNLDLSINYFNIDYNNQIGNYSRNTSVTENPAAYASIITYCAYNPNHDPAQVSKCNQLLSQYVNGPGALPVFGPIASDANGIGVFVNGSSLNLATTQTDGLDFHAEYGIPNTAVGSLGLGVNATYYLDYKQSQTPGAPVVNVLNTIGYPLRLRLRSNVKWNRGPWEAVVFVNYAGSYLNNQAAPVQQVSDWTTVDLHLGFSFDAITQAPWLKNSRIALDVTNLFGTDPPFVALIPSVNGGGGFDANVASPIGRIVAVTLSKKF